MNQQGKYVLGPSTQAGIKGKGLELDMNHAIYRAIFLNALCTDGSREISAEGMSIQ